MRFHLSIIVKLTGLVVFLVVATAFAVNEVHIRGSSQILIEQAIDDLKRNTDFFRYPVKTHIERIKDDLLLLENLQAIRELIRSRSHEGIDPKNPLSETAIKDRLTSTFTEMMGTRKNYLQIKIIGVEDEGKEILRVEQFGNRIERVPENTLQLNGAEPYFQDTLRIGPNNIYLSTPNLNREHEKVIEPHILVLHAAVPLYTRAQEVFGIVLVKINFGNIVRDIGKELSKNYILYIVNRDGDYLLHPDPSKLYAKDLGHNDRIQRDEPRLLAVTGNTKEDRVTLLPDDIDGGNILTYQKVQFDSLNPDNYLGVAIQVPYRDIIRKTVEVNQRGFIFSMIIAFIAVIAAIFLLHLSIRPLNRIADGVVRYRKGEKDIDLPTNSPDEIGLLAREFQAMMKQKDEEDWGKETLVRISQNILGFKKLEDLANTLMESLTMAVGAQVGVLYISSTFREHRAQRDMETLAWLGASGYQTRDSLPQSFRWGEGLVGQCAKDRNMRILSDIPNDYLRIASALGETQPKHILLLPVLFENTLVGVIELASINGFSDVHLTFLKQLAFNAGVIINSISASSRTEELLEETRMAAEELQRNEEELKTQQEEMEASNEALEEKTKALEEQNAQISQQTKQLNASNQLIEEKVQELELAGKYKSEFLANMSHELRTPLNSLLILAKILSSNEEGNLTPEQVEEANVIYDGGLDLLRLINDILDLSKVEAGKLNIVVEDVLLTDIVKRLDQQFEPILKESGLSFSIKVADNLPVIICTDSQRAEQILTNLLSNAFKFTKAGSVTLEIFRPDNNTSLQRASLAHGSTIAFAVTDTGIGIEESKLHTIFEAFQQEGGSIDRNYVGTGLGLTIARKFANLLGGEIHVISKKNEGSTFTLLLPDTWTSADIDAVDLENAEPPVPAQQQKLECTEPNTMPKAAVREFIPDDRNSIGANDKILLIIEDDKDFAKTLMKVGHKRGYKCLVAGDGKTGILLAAEQPVSAITLDLTLPDIDGITVLGQLKHDLRTRHIPVHIITGRDEEDPGAQLRNGAIGSLTKPVETEGIEGAFKKIEHLLQSRIKKILVIEDDQKSQTAIQRLLKKKDVEITCTGTGHAALQRIAEERFDCIILDLLLPDMTGFEWLDEVADQADLPPCIIYTAKELTEEENRKLNSHTGSIVIKGAHSSERLLDEVTLFLHSIESTLSKEQQAIIQMQHHPDKILQNRKVLFVDDDLRNTFALSKILKKHGMNVVIADNGQMAIEKLRQDKEIELVIMDIMMPVMDGYQAMRAIRMEKHLKELPIIALTARAMPGEQEKCMEAGANDYLMKPVDIERLLTLMRVWLFKQVTVP
ncbi:MAG: response regulator [Nitrospirales bacterium]